tara:strand:- start:1590 stop:2234 length:645 start_codon:yes stop_codon:yes gene_type:complete
MKLTKQKLIKIIKETMEESFEIKDAYIVGSKQMRKEDAVKYFDELLKNKTVKKYMYELDMGVERFEGAQNVWQNTDVEDAEYAVKLDFPANFMGREEDLGLAHVVIAAGPKRRAWIELAADETYSGTYRSDYGQERFTTKGATEKELKKAKAHEANLTGDLARDGSMLTKLLIHAKKLALKYATKKDKMTKTQRFKAAGDKAAGKKDSWFSWEE